jgi:pentatricopeptide repeat protein
MHYHPGFGRAAKGEALASADVLRFKKWNCDGYSHHGGGAVEEDDRGNNSSSSSSSSSDFSDAPDTTTASITSGDYGARQAERLLDWALAMDLVPRGLFDNCTSGPTHGDDEYINDPMARSPNSTCVNIIETYLLPTAYGGAGGTTSSAASTVADDIIVGDADVGDALDTGITSGAPHHGSNNNNSNNRVTLTKRRAIDPAHVQAVADAYRVMNKMKRLHTDYPNFIRPDSLSVKAELNVWSKRAMLLGGRNRKETFDRGGGCINDDDDDPCERLRQLEQQRHEDASSSSLLLSIDDDDDAYTSRGCIERMEAILMDAEARYVDTKDEEMHPCSDWYNHVLGAWSRSDDVQTAAERTREILRGMETYADANSGAGRKGNNDTRRRYLASPDTVTYNIGMNCLSNANTGCEGAMEVESIFRILDERYRRTRDPGIRPDEVTYGVVLHALARAGMAHEAEGILDILEDESQRGSRELNNNDAAAVVPSLTIYNTVLNAWANSHSRDAPARAESLIERMRILSSTGRNPNAEPDSISLSSVISCHARSKTRRGAERGERLLNEAIDMYTKGNSRVKPDSIMYNCAIMGWTNVSGIENEQQGIPRHDLPPERAEALLRRMKASNLDMGAQTFNHILDCWAKSEIKGCAERAVKLLREMPKYGVKPDDFSYNTLLHALSKESDQWVDYAENILQEMKDMKIVINKVTYHGLMNVFGKSRSKDGAKKAEEYLRGMEAEGLSLNEMTYNICIDAYARRGDYKKATSLLDEMISLSNHGNVECRPSIHSFAAVVNALAKSGDADAVARAEEVVRRVEEVDFVTPNSILYNSLIDCMVKSRHTDSSLQAEKVLLKMEQMHRSGNRHVQPNSYAYSMVLTCCARSKDPGSAERAERILLNMERLYSEGLSDVIANSRCYSAAITAWARSNSPTAIERTFALIDRMEQNGKDGSPHGKPNAHCYNACIHAIAKSQLPGKARKCQEVLQRMDSAKSNGFHESAPSLITYSTIINGEYENILKSLSPPNRCSIFIVTTPFPLLAACAFTNGNEIEKQEAFDLARTCFLTLMESNDMEPCVSSFTNFFHVVSRHLKDGMIRDQFAEALFRECCRRGKVDNQTLDAFRKSSPLVAHRILSDHRILPAEWQRNITSDGYKLQ